MVENYLMEKLPLLKTNSEKNERRAWECELSLTTERRNLSHKMEIGRLCQAHIGLSMMGTSTTWKCCFAAWRRSGLERSLEMMNYLSENIILWNIIR